jgi:hypothetical protein
MSDEFEALTKEVLSRLDAVAPAPSHAPV